VLRMRIAVHAHHDFVDHGDVEERAGGRRDDDDGRERDRDDESLHAPLMPEKSSASIPLDRRMPSGYARHGVMHPFAYGTLLGGRRPAAIARTAERLAVLGPATVRGRLYDLGEYPGLVLDPAANEVHGTICTVPDEAVLAALDAYEGFEPDAPARSLFVRTPA